MPRYMEIPEGDDRLPPLPIESVKKFMETLNFMRSSGQKMLEELDKDVSEEKGANLLKIFALNMKTRQNCLENCILSLNKDIKELKTKISEITSVEAMPSDPFDGKKLELEMKTKTTMLMLARRELKREEFYKQKAMEKFLERCVTNLRTEYLH